jgi:anti-anti-sigma factor
MTVDFDEVDYIDTSGLAVLVEVLKAAREQGKTFHLSRLRERPRYLLEATRVLHLFDEVSDEEPQASRLSPERPR